MKNLFVIFLILCFSVISSCSSGKSSSQKHEKKGDNSEIGYAEMEGGELLRVFGYSKDVEVDSAYHAVY